MKVTVDSSKCQGHNRCMILAADTFEVDDFGYAHVPEDKRDVTAERRDSVVAAARNCPEQAIQLTEV